MKNVQATSVFLTGAVSRFWLFGPSLLVSWLLLIRCAAAAAADVRLCSLDAAKSEKEYETRKSRRKGHLGLWGPPGSEKGP